MPPPIITTFAFSEEVIVYVIVILPVKSNADNTHCSQIHFRKDR